MANKEYWTDIFTPQKLWAVFFITFNEGYQINTIFPFVVFMIRDFEVSENLVGLYAVLLASAFALGQCISSYFWGWFSDYKGRKIALLLGLSVSGIAIIIFGLSKTFIQAIAARVIAGIFNGNIGVARAYLADITDSNNRAFAFSIFAIAFSAGIILGSTVGGVLIHSYELDEYGIHTPSESVLRFWIFEYYYPYLPPCIFGACISLFAFILTAMYVRFEPQHKSKPNYTDVREESSIQHSGSNSRPLPHNIPSKKSLDHSLGTSIPTSVTSPLHNVVKAFKQSKPEKTKLLNIDDHNECLMEDGDDFTRISTLRQLLNKTNLIHALVINCANAVMIMTWNAMVPLLMAQVLEFDATKIGIQMAFCGVVLFVFTWWIQPPLLKKYNYKFLYVVVGSLMIFVAVLFPSITVIPNVNDWNKWLLLSVVSIVGSLKFIATTNMVVTSFCFLNNSVPRHTLGRANGFSAALTAGLRGVGSFIAGALWSWSMTFDSKMSVYIAYIFMALPSAYSVFHCWMFIEHDIQIVFEERMKIKQANMNSN